MYYPVNGFDDDRGDGFLMAVHSASGTEGSRSFDDGASWAAMSFNPATRNLTAASGIASNKTCSIIVGPRTASDPFPGSRRAFRSFDAGATQWEDFQLPDVNAVSFVSNDFGCPRFIQSLNQFWVLCSSGGVGYLCYGDENADNWQITGRIDAPGAGPGPLAFDYSPTLGTGQGRLVVVGTSVSGPMTRYSDDLGATWTTGSGLPNPVFNDIVWVPALDMFVTGRGAAGPNYYSLDGSSFSACSGTGFGRSFAVFEANIIGTDILGGGGSPIYVSSTGTAFAQVNTDGLTSFQTAVYNGRIWGLGSYGAPANFKDFGYATDPNGPWQFHTNVMLNTNTVALAARFVGE